MGAVHREKNEKHVDEEAGEKMLWSPRTQNAAVVTDTSSRLHTISTGNQAANCLRRTSSAKAKAALPFWTVSAHC